MKLIFIFFILFFLYIDVVRAQTTSPTSKSPTTSGATAPNTCAACATSACLYYEHAYAPTVQYVSIGCSSTLTPAPSVCLQSGDFGTGANGLYTFGGALTQVNIAAVGGATGKIQLGANGPTPSAQPIIIGGSTSGTIQVGGTVAAVSIAPGTNALVNIGGGTGDVKISGFQTGGDTYIGQSTQRAIYIGLSAPTAGSISIGALSKAPVQIGDYTASPSPTPSQTINIGNGGPNSITVGGASSTVTIAANTNGAINIGAGTTNNIAIGSSSAAPTVLDFGAGSLGTVRLGEGAAQIRLGEGMSSSGVMAVATSSKALVYIGDNTASPTPTPSQTINIGTGSPNSISIGSAPSTITIGVQTAPSTATTITLNNAFWNQWGMWFLPVSQAVTSGSFLSFASNPTVPTPTPAPSVATNQNAYAPSPTFTVGNCRAFVSSPTYFPAPTIQPYAVSYPCGNTVSPPSPTPSPVTFSGDCVYTSKSGLYTVSTFFQNSASPTAPPTFYAQFCMVSATGSPATLGYNYAIIGGYLSANTWYAAGTNNFYCSSPPCLFSVALNYGGSSPTIAGGVSYFSVKQERV